ncbi:MAG: biotin/lipoyl-containing protein [Candidatus Poseidoniales archaeon]|jgi:biotin carboxyl carrier protein|tara:strand:- start:124 stop:534 length:411 start_codon:yes stop_codon:yes gene_type:complete
MTESRKVIVDGVEFEVELENEGDTWTAVVEGRSFEIKIPGGSSAPKKKRPGSRSKKSGVVSANMPGKVVTIEVSQAEEVIEGQVILILEAMKMQNEIQAPVSGIIKSINCEEGQSIEANIPLVVIEPHTVEGEKDE